MRFDIRKPSFVYLAAAISLLLAACNNDKESANTALNAAAQTPEYAVLTIAPRQQLYSPIFLPRYKDSKTSRYVLK